MSSRNRRSKGAENPTDPFLTDSTTELPTFASVDRQGYGGPLLGKLDKHINAKPIPIGEIHPDPTQPRRTIPFPVRQKWDGDMKTLFNRWVSMVNDERENVYFDLDALIHTTGDDVRNPNPKPIEAALLGVIDLAASILRDGLTNPITIVRSQNRYFLETGERRWLAYHLLHQHTQDEQWAKIPARVMDEFNVWRQAGENNARDNLNAIGRARQLALLLMDLYRAESIEFETFDQLVLPGKSDRPFYAQVADGETWRIPRGKAEQLLNAIGLKSVRQLSQYRALLNLPDEAWMTADDTNLSEYRLRQILDMKLDESATLDLIHTAAQEYGSDSGTVVPVQPKTNAEKSPLQPQIGASGTILGQEERKTFKKFIDLAGTVRLEDIPSLDTKRKAQLLEWTRHVREIVEKIEQAAEEKPPNE